MEREDEIEKRVQNYWTVRTKDFNTVRMNELHGEISKRWTAELRALLPQRIPLKILDAGTGTGFFAILLTGIDLTPTMLEAADRTAGLFGIKVRFEEMNVQETCFESESFDAVVTRNVTWTLPDPEKAYREWHRILNSGIRIYMSGAHTARSILSVTRKVRC